ncbi:XRE family transcriptional regulator [Marinobacter sp. DUT-1]|uniref:XRE family transcriptional regulator n=1 Tax=Marinobacter sp. DUT-1 TaxID=3412037 RepID=UPI003D17E62B
MPDHNDEDKIEGIGGRIAHIRGSMSQAAFAEKLGVHKNSLGNYERENRTPDAGFLAKLIANGYDSNWILTGVGEPKLQREKKSSNETDESGLRFEEEFALIPGYNVQVAAGHGSIAGDEAPTRELAFRRKWLRFRGLHEQDLALVFAKGDSMEPTISDNETVMVDTSEKKLRDGHIYVIRNGDHLLVKRIQTLWNDGVQLLSDNKEYPPQEIASSDLENLEVIGKVVWVGKDL